MVKTPSNSSILSYQGLFPSPLSKLHLPGEFFPGRGENVGSGVGSKSKLGVPETTPPLKPLWSYYRLLVGNSTAA